ncbi:hypothetical protein [Kytococcus sedentarius]|uniref:hypothetical protein n=1 Tax=Kytococcus sedentarius TaxID=1276 RepID=UPI0019504090|nr:hypothetical protein [Kytococcus sedentarius]QRO86905.1 hypothetical protein I6J30_08630 [Kytococcus sedentarius]
MSPETATVTASPTESDSSDAGGGKQKALLSNCRMMIRPVRAPPAPGPPRGGEDDSSFSAIEGEYVWEEVLEGEHMNLTVGEPKRFKPSDPDGLQRYDMAVVQEVRVENKSDVVLDPNNFYFTATTGDLEAERIFDSANGITYPDARIRPGRTLKFNIGWAVDKGKELAVTPEYMDYENEIGAIATWAGQLP